MRKENSPSPSIGGVITRETDTVQNSQTSTSSQSGQQVELSQGFIIEEVMRKLQALLDQKPKESKWKKFSTNPLVLLTAGVILSGILGGAITLAYGARQNELAAERSFSDELNKLRIQKFSEVWERLDEDEGAIDRLLNQPDDPQNPEDKNERAKQVDKLIQQDRRTVDKHRFWVGNENHAMIHRYLDASSLYAIRKLAGINDGLDALLQHRKTLKSDLDQERDKSLESLAERAKLTKWFYFF
jgi:hypothetical protein